MTVVTVSLDEANKIKRAKLQDILKRVVANPMTIAEVADQIADDWYPMFNVDEKGNMSIVIGNGQKK